MRPAFVIRAVLGAGLVLAPALWPPGAEAAPEPVADPAAGLFAVRDGLPCHTSDYAPRRLVWAAAPGLAGVRAVHPHPEVSATVYAVTDDGLFRSDDFAGSWQRAPLAGPGGFGRITDLAFRPGTPATFCFGTRSNGVWISRDGGCTARPVGSRASGMAADAVEGLIYVPGDILHRTVLVAHGLAAPGISRGDTDAGTWTVTAPAYHVYRILPGNPQGRDLCLFAGSKAEPDGVGIYYASVLGAYWQRQVGDVLPTDAVWYPPSHALYVTTLDRGLLKIEAGGSSLQELGGGEAEWFGVGTTWGPHADAPGLYLYQPTPRGLLWTTNTLAGATEQSRGLYRGAFISGGAHIRANAGGTRFYGAINGSLWVGSDAMPLRVDTVALEPGGATVAAAAFDGGFWRTGDDALRGYTTTRRAAVQAARLGELVREMNGAIPVDHGILQARVTAPAGVVPLVTADLSRLGLSSTAPLAPTSNGLYELAFDLTGEGLCQAAGRRNREWRSSWPGPLPITVSAQVAGSPAAGGVGVFALYRTPEALTFGRDHWALGLGDTLGTVTFNCERDNPDQYWVPLHQRLTVGPGPWRARISHMAVSANVADFHAMTFLIRSPGPAAGGEMIVQLSDKPADAMPFTTPGVPLLAGGYLAGGAVTTDYRRVTIPMADLLRGGAGFNPEQFHAVVLSGTNAAACTYLIDDWKFVVSRPGPDPADGRAP